MKYNLEYTTIIVKDLEKSVKFYTEALGFKEVDRINSERYRYTAANMVDEKNNVSLFLMCCPEFRDRFFIAVNTENVETSYKKHKEMGHKVSNLQGDPPNFYLLIDPDGNKVEVLGTQYNEALKTKEDSMV